MSEADLIRNFIQSGDLVFDVGANIGNKAELYLSLGAKVVCVEPQPNLVKTLSDRFNNNPNIYIENIGLSDKKGILDLSVCSVANTISTFSEEWVTRSRFSSSYVWDHKIQVGVDTLDSLISKYGLPRFCKIDVENYEHIVLQGLNQKIQCISLEFAIETLQSNTQKCLDRLVSLGFSEFNFTLGVANRLILDKWVDSVELIKELEYSVEHRGIEGGGLIWGDFYAR